MVDFTKHLKSKPKPPTDDDEFVLGHLAKAFAPDPKSFTQTFVGTDVSPYTSILRKAWVDAWPNINPMDVVKWEVAEKLETMTYILAAELKDGGIHTVECTKDYLMQAGKFNQPNPPMWEDQVEKFCDKTCRAFLTEAFGQSSQNASVLTLMATKGKIMLCKYAGTCPACAINFAKETVIIYGVPSPQYSQPLAYHPGCFLRELAYEAGPNSTPKPGAMRYSLRSMGRTADEMRWRRRAKTTCSVSMHDLIGGQDPTIPERHGWRCNCPVAPWNLTKQQRQETRNKYGVKK